MTPDQGDTWVVKPAGWPPVAVSVAPPATPVLTAAKFPAWVPAKVALGLTAEPEAVQMIIDFEESGLCKPHPYLDPVGIPTMGYGSIWDWRTTPKSRVTMQTPAIDERTARLWLGLELTTVVITLCKNVKVPLSHHEASSLESFMYNVGSGAFVGSTLLKLLNAGDHAGAAAELLKWDMAGGHHVAGLMNRRIAEKKVMETPDV